MQIFALRPKPRTLEPKTNFTPFHISWLPSTEADILTTTIVTSHIFPLKVMNPKNIMSVTPQGLRKLGGLIAPPPVTWKCPLTPSVIGLIMQNDL